MKYRQLVAELIASGCYVVRHGANHDIWFSPSQVADVPFLGMAQRKLLKEPNEASEGF